MDGAGRNTEDSEETARRTARCFELFCFGSQQVRAIVYAARGSYSIEGA